MTDIVPVPILSNKGGAGYRGISKAGGMYQCRVRLDDGEDGKPRWKTLVPATRDPSMVRRLPITASASAARSPPVNPLFECLQGDGANWVAL